MQEGWKKELIEWAKSISFALIIVFVIKSFLFDIVAIDGISMQPTLYDKDRVFVSILSYEIGAPKHQDIIVFTPPVDKDSYFVKRVIGIPGDTVKISGLLRSPATAMLGIASQI
jgi:signal peptidase I